MVLLVASNPKACQDRGNILRTHPLFSELVHRHVECLKGDSRYWGWCMDSVIWSEVS